MSASLHITKVAFGCDSVEILVERLAAGAIDGVTTVGTRYKPKRSAELIGGSLFWILKHRLVARSLILDFVDGDGGRCAIRVASRLVPVMPQPRRAHQGWRYLAAEDAPVDISAGAGDIGDLPKALLDELATLALI